MKANATRRRFATLLLLWTFLLVFLQGCGETLSLKSFGGSPAGPPVYNAVLESIATGKTTGPALSAGVPHRLHFWIGPRDIDSVLFSRQPHADILRSTSDMRLRVVLGCAFCTSYGVSQQAMAYSPGAGESNRVGFEFVPGDTDLEGRPRTLQLSIYDDATGRLFDEISIAVSLVSTTNPQVAKHLVLPISPRPDRLLYQPDATLHITEQDRTGLTITLVPVSQRVKDAVGDLVLDRQGAIRSFQTGPEAVGAFKGLGIAENARMSAISLQGSLAKRLQRTGTIPLISDGSRETSTLTEQESRQVTQLIGEYGRTLHRLLFCPTAEDPLCKAIAALEALAASNPDQPLRISISSGEVSLPWQYLHPAGMVVDAQKFWGVKFSLAIHRSRPAGTASHIPSPARATARKVVFAQYAVESNEAFGKSVLQIDKLRGLPVPPENLLVVRSREQLMTGVFEQKRNEVAAIITFLHAKSGASVDPYSANVVTTAEGPVLEFADKDAISSDQLMRLYGTTTDEHYFGGGPLVILNACETGSSGTAMPHVRLQDALFMLGARGVVVTEVPVWIPLGHEIGMLLIEELGRGVPAPDALTTVRRKILSQHRNPLGLLYAYYGEPGVTLNR